MLQCCAAYTSCPFLSAPGLAASSARRTPVPRAQYSATATARLALITNPPRRSVDTGGLRYHSSRVLTRRRGVTQSLRDRLEDPAPQDVQMPGEVVSGPRDGDHPDAARQAGGERQDL